MSTLVTASIFLLVLWPAYAALLKYSDRYALNRFLLVAAMVAVCALPFVSLESPAPVITQSLQGTIEYVEQSTYPSLALMPEAEAADVTVNPTALSRPAESAAVPVPTTTLLYFGGVGLMLLLLSGRLLLLLALHLRSRPDEGADYRLLHPGASPGQAFTFGSSVYFSQDVPGDPDFAHILAHERVHARQLHSVDIILTEVFLCVFWFHPAAWWLRTQMRANLEYLVDKAVVNQGADRRNYQLALVRQSVVAQGLALALPFSEPSLKSRISRMTGLPEYRVIGILAAVALTFWLGVAMVVVNGSFDQSSDIIDLSEMVEIPELLNAENYDLGAIVADNTQADVNGISSFALYLRRLPTPYEFAQISQLLEPLDYTRLTLYHPCAEEDGGYALQLSHWLNVEARLPRLLKEGELLDHHFVLKLEPNGLFNLVPKEPLVSAGYFTPVVRETVWDETNPGPRIYYIDKDTNVEDLVSNQDAKNLPSGKLPLQDYRDELADEEIAVFINGERKFLKKAPPVRVDVFGSDKDRVDGVDVKVNGEPVPTWSKGYFASWSEVEAASGALPVPANERMNCLLGMTGNTFSLTRNVRSGYTGSSRAWFEGLTLPEGREVLYYHNDDRSTASDVLDREFQYADVQVGFDSSNPHGPIIVQAIDDLY